jgi:hypothetical protein
MQLPSKDIGTRSATTKDEIAVLIPFVRNIRFGATQNPLQPITQYLLLPAVTP